MTSVFSGRHRPHVIRPTTARRAAPLFSTSQVLLRVDRASFHLFVQYQEQVDRYHLRQHVEDEHNQTKRCRRSVEYTRVVAPLNITIITIIAELDMGKQQGCTSKLDTLVSRCCRLGGGVF